MFPALLLSGKEICMIRILLDNGHGIETPGKRSPQWADGRQLLEWKFNREMVNRVEKLLNTMGITCVQLVPEEQDISILERCRRANRWASESDCLLISIHANAGGGTGGEVFTYPGAKQSREYAKAFQNNWNQYLPDFPFRGCKESNFGILRESHSPAVLIECLFMDNPKDCEVMLSPKGKERIAQWITHSIQEITDKFYPTR